MESYICRDFYCASFIIYKGIPLLSHRREAGKTLFYFQFTDQLKELVDSYYSMNAEVSDVLTFCGIVRNLKNIIHTVKTSDQKISTSKSENRNHESITNCGDKL